MNIVNSTVSLLSQHESQTRTLCLNGNLYTSVQQYCLGVFFPNTQLVVDIFCNYFFFLIFLIFQTLIGDHKPSNFFRTWEEFQLWSQKGPKGPKTAHLTESDFFIICIQVCPLNLFSLNNCQARCISLICLFLLCRDTSETEMASIFGGDNWIDVIVFYIHVGPQVIFSC